jgi:serine protease Do
MNYPIRILVAVVVCLSGAAHAAELPTQQAIRRARDHVFPALVHIQAVSSLFQGGRKQQSVSAGSGVVISDQGYIITNYHVVGRADSVICTLSDKRQVRAKRIGGDPWTDLAVIQIDAKELKGEAIRVAEFGEMAQVEAGDYVLAMGSPLSLSRSISLGIVSCADRYLPGGYKLPTGEPTGLFNTWIQTDAAINPGNSGGPLVNLEGKIIGINARGVTQASNIGFAIPVDVVTRVSSALIKHKQVARSWIGVTLQPLRGVDGAAGRSVKQGVVVGGVEEGSPADTAGLRPGDRLLELNGQELSAVFLEEVPAVYRRIAEIPLDKVAVLKYTRNGKALDVEIKAEPLSSGQPTDREIAAFGLVVRNITNEDVRVQNLADRVGALVQSVSATGPAGLAGLRNNDIIIEMNREPVKNVGDLIRIFGKLPKDQARTLVRYRRGFSVNIALVRRGK